MMQHRRKGMWTAIGALGLALAVPGAAAWAEDGNNIYIATPDGQLMPEAPGEQDNAYSPDAVHTYRWDGGIIVKEYDEAEDPGVIGVQPDPATANVDPAEVPPGNVVVQEPIEKQME